MATKEINYSNIRQNLASVIKDVYQNGHGYIVTKNKIPMITISKYEDNTTTSRKVKINLNSKAFGAWKHMKGSTIDIADELRRRASGRN